MKDKVCIDRLKAVVPFCVVSCTHQFSFCQRNAAAHTPPSRRHPRVQRDWSTNMSFGALPGVKPPTRTGWTVSGTSAEIWANLWASSLEPLFEVSQGHLGQVKSKTRMVCAAFQVSSCVHFRGRFLSRPSRRRRGLRFWSIVRPQQHQKGSPAAGALQWLETSVSFVKIWGNHGKTRTSHGYSTVWKATSSQKWRMESKSTRVFFYKETPCRNYNSVVFV